MGRALEVWLISVGLSQLGLRVNNALMKLLSCGGWEIARHLFLPSQPLILQSCSPPVASLWAVKPLYLTPGSERENASHKAEVGKARGATSLSYWSKQVTNSKGRER